MMSSKKPLNVPEVERRGKFLTALVILVLFTSLFSGLIGAANDEAEQMQAPTDLTSNGIQVLTPAGGEVLKGGEVIDIGWKTPDDVGFVSDSINVYYSIDNGESWVLIGERVADERSFAWTLPHLDSEECFVKVTATDIAGYEYTALSDSAFTIDSTPPSVKVISPDGDESWNSGTVQEIIWTAEDNHLLAQDTIDIYYTRDGGFEWVLIAEEEENDGTFAWRIPFDDSGTCQVKIGATDVAGNLGWDTSDGYFSMSDNLALGLQGSQSSLTGGQDADPLMNEAENVLGPVAYVIVTPDPATVEVGTQQQFTATAYDSNNSVIPGATFFWGTNVGVVIYTGLLTAQTTPAAGHVSATYDSVTGSANVTVVPGNVHHIVVTPTPVSVEVGGTQPFSATAYDIYNSLITGVGFDWSTNVGSVDPDGFFTAQTVPGIGVVSATNGSATGLAGVQVVVGQITSIVVTPDPVTVIAGKTRQFIAAAHDQYGNVIPGVPFSWSTTVGSVNTDGLFTAQTTPGAGQVLASNGTVSGFALVTVAVGTIDRIDVLPNPVSLKVGDTQLFSATAYDEYDNVISGVIFDWSTDAGTVDFTGLFTAQTAPTVGIVEAGNASVTGSADVTVTLGDTDHIIVVPDPVSLDVGGTQQFVATAYDAYNNVIPGVVFVWSTDVGSVDATGFFTAQTVPGTGVVEATNGTLTGTAVVTVNVGNVDHIVLVPDTVSLKVGETRQFTAAAYDQYDNLIPDAVFFWSSDVGVVNSTGFFSAQTIPGSGFVNVTSGSVTETANVTVLIGDVHHIVVSPSSFVIKVGDSQVFTAAAYDPYNNSIAGVGFAWSTDIGTVDATGFFTAQTTPGIGVVSVMNGTVTGSADVQVVIGDIDSIAVSPDPATVAVGTQQQFTATALDRYGNPIPDVTFIWSSDVGLVDGNGLFTAQTTVATGYVEAMNNSLPGTAVIDLVPGPLDHIGVVPDIITVTVGDTQQFVATGFDVYNNIIGGMNFDWTTDVGSVDADGLLTAQTEPGSGIVEAKNESVTGIATVNVIIGVLDHILVLPSPHVITVGETQQFTATAYDAFDNVVPGVVFFWSTDLGVVNSTGFFTADTVAKSGYINATAGSVTGSAIVDVIATTLDHIVVTPSPVSVVVGTQQQFTATAYDAYDNVIPNAIYFWSTNIGVVNYAGLFTARSTTGTGYVRATSGSVIGTASVTLIPSFLHHIVVSPNPATVIVGEDAQFTGTAYDIYNNMIPGVDFTWSSSVGSIDSNGILTAQTIPGTGTVTATNGTISGTAIVYVISDIVDHIIVSPDPATVVVGGNQMFTAVAYDAYGNVIPGISFVWSTNVGVVDSSGMLTAQTSPGFGVVTAISGTISGSANVEIVVGELDHIFVTPHPVTVVVGGTQQFQASGYDIYGNEISGLVFTWTTTVGTVNSNGLFTARTTPTAGAVRAFNGSVGGLAIAIIVVGPVNHILVTPDPATVTVGSSQPFTAVAYDIYNNTISGVSFSWSTNVGTVNPSGLFTAQTVPGTGFVSATNGSVTGTAIVNVVVGQVDHILVVPDPITIVVGDGLSFTATAYDMYDNVISGAVFDWSTDVGTVDATGYFTAQTTPGIGNVTATNWSVSGSAIVTVIIGALDHIGVTPDPADVGAGESQQFTAVAYDAYDNVITGVTFTWATNVGVITSMGILMAQTVPTTGTVNATSGGVTGYAVVNVVPGPVALIYISPDPLTIVVGDSQQFTTVAYDAYNNLITSVDYVWTTNVGTVDSSGLFTAQTTPGSGTVTATNGTVSGVATVYVIKGPLHHIMVTPNPWTMTADSGKQFLAAGYDLYDNPVSISPTWETDGGGSVDVTGYFIADVVGTWTIFANYSGVSGNATITILHGAPVSIDVTPDTAIVTADDVLIYTATAIDSNGNSWDVTAGTAFTENDPKGTIVQNAYFAGQVGNWTVIGNYGGLVDSATVTVIPGAAAFIILDSPVSTVAGEPFSVTVTVYDADDNVKTDYAGTITITSSDPYPATLPPDHTFTGGDAGTFTFTGLILFIRPSQTVTATDTSNSTLTDSDYIDVLSPFIQPEKTGPETAEPVDIIMYRIYINNTGETAAANVWLNDTLPAGVTFIGASSGGVHFGGVVWWHFTNLLPGIWSVIVTCSVNVGLPNGLILTNWAYCNYTTTNNLYKLPETRANATTRVHYLPEMDVDKVVELVIKDIIVEPDQWGICTLGITLSYVVNITNLQSIPDSVDLEYSSLLSWGVEFLQSDGKTPLADTNMDPQGLPDTGILAPNGGTVSIVVNHTVPTSATEGDEDVVFVTGTSFADPNVIDIARLNTTAVASPPKEVVLVLDTSGSMGGPPIIDLRNAAITLVNQLDDTDYVALIRFINGGSTPWLLQGLTQLNPIGRSQTIANINTLNANGGTPIWDAIWDGINLVDGTANIPVVVAITDGEDYNSHSNGYHNDDPQESPDGDSQGRQGQDDGNTDDDYGDPYDPSGDGDGGICVAPMHVFTIGLSVTTTSEHQLQEVGRTSAGGEYYFAPTSAQLQEIYEAIAQEINQLGGSSAHGSKEAISAGDELLYKVFYNNTGIGNAGDVWVNDSLPDCLDLVDTNASVPYQYIGGYYSWHFQDVTPGTHWFWIEVEIDNTVVDYQDVVNEVVLEYTDDEGNYLGHSSDTATVTVSEPAIQVEKVTTTVTAEPGDYVTYTIYFNNTGSCMALYVWINESFDPYLEYVSDTAQVIPSVNGNTYTWELPGVKPGSYQFDVTVRVRDGTPGGMVIGNQAVAEYTNEDNVKLDHVASSQIVNITINNTRITVDKIVDDEITDPIKLLTYTLYFNNTGTDDAGYVWVNDTLPAEVTYVSDTSTTSPTTWQYYWSKSIFGRYCRFIFRAVTPGVHMFQITVQVKAGTPDGTYIINNVTMDYTDNYGYNLPGSEDSALSICGVLNVTKRSDLTVIPVGGTTILRLTIDVKNCHHSQDLNDIHLNDTLPPGITWMGNVIASSGSWSWDGNILNWTVANLEALETATLSYDVSVFASGVGSYQLNNGASAYGTTDSNYVENATSNAVYVNAQFAPVLDFTISPSTAISNSVTTYTLFADNIGTDGIFHDAGNDEITIQIPSTWGNPSNIICPPDWNAQWSSGPRVLRFTHTGGFDYDWPSGTALGFDFDIQAPSTQSRETFYATGSIHDSGGIQYINNRALFVDLVIGPLHHIRVQPHPLVCRVGETHNFTATAYDMWNNVILGVGFNWTTNVGYINETGVFTAPTTPIIGRVNASNGSVWGWANVAVYAGAADRIVVTPDPATVTAGEARQFTASAFDAYDNPITFIDFVWTTDVGTVDTNGLFTAQLTPGSGRVTATNGSVSGNATVNVIAGFIDHIIVTPDPVIVVCGEDQQFTATAYDVYNNTLPGVDFVWTSDVGSVDDTGFYTAQATPGIGTVTATNGSANGLANIDVVVGPFDHITVTPNPANVVVGQARVFTAVAYDACNNALPGYVFTWDTDVGTINSAGVFFAQTTPGTGHVNATNGTITGSAVVNVISGSIDHIVVTPDPASVVVGSTQAFVALAYDVYNNVIPGIDFIWSTNVGSIDDTGLLTAQTYPGSGVVSAWNGTISGSATVEVIVGGVDHITVTPSPVSIKVGNTQMFTAIAYDAYDNPIPEAVFVWTTDVGTVDGTGFFTAQTTPQAGYVNATYGTVTGTANVNVVVGNAATITVTPDPATVAVGDHQQFTAVAYDAYNNPIPNPIFIWTSNVGVVNSTGYFTAQTIPAMGIVSARILLVTGSASVEVARGPLHHIAVTPDPLSITVGDSQAFTAVGYDAYNNIIPGVGFTWTTDVGTIDSSGFFTAQTTTGTGFVYATNGTVTGIADVEVVAGALDHVIVIPNPANVEVGETLQFTATAYDVYNNIITGVDFIWSTDVGSVDGTGLFKAQTTPGAGTVTAMNNTIGDTAAVNVLLGGIHHIVVDPDPVTVVVGDVQSFNATAYDYYDNIIPGVVFDWSTNVGSVDAAGFFTAQTVPGTGVVTAANGTVFGSASVQVIAGAVDHIVVTPDPLTIIVGDMQAFTAIAYDSYDNVITGVVFDWTTDVGSIDSSGFFTAQTIPGTGTVTAANGTVSGIADVDVVVGTVIDHIIVVPDPVSVVVGEQELFTATAYDEYDNIIVGVDFLWTTNVGTIDGTGLLTAQTTPKVGAVTARNNTVTCSAVVTVIPGAVDSIVVSPNPATVTVGDTQQFIATAYDSYNNVIPEITFVWTTDVGSVDTTGLFTAQTIPGLGTVTAASGNVSDSADVEVVVGDIDHIIVTPDPATVTVGNGLKFTTVAYDLYDNPISNAIFIWKTNVGVVNSTGYLTARTTPCTGWVNATAGGVTGAANVDVVVGAVHQIILAPDPLSITVGGSQQFTATAYDIYNNLIPDADFTWTTNVGFVNATGFFTARTTPGVGTVTATNCTVSGSAFVEVMIGDLDHIVIVPNTVSVAAGGTQPFIAIGLDLYNNVISGVIFDWTTDVGSIDTSGLLTAQTTPAVGSVTATNGTVNGSAAVYVVPGPVDRIVIDPDNVTLSVGDSQSFTATAFDIYDNVVTDAELVWTTDVGAVDQNGLFTAQTFPGTGTVTAANGTVSDSADVDVLIGALDHIIVSPDPVTVTVGEQQQFTAVAYDSYDNVITGVIFDWTTDVGSVDTAGLLTAQTASGIGVVTAANNTVSHSATVTVAPGLVDHIIVTPDPLSIIVNGVQQFHAVAYDIYNNSIPDVIFVWTTDVGSINASGFFTAQPIPGSGIVTATNGTVFDSANVDVIDVIVDHITITPDPATVTVGGSQLFIATAYDQFNNVIMGVEFLWTTDVGSVDTAGLFTAQTFPGLGTVKAANGTINYSATVDVVPGPVDHIIVLPDPATVIVGDSQAFTATAYDSYDNVLSGVAFVWTTDVGAIDASGMFTARTVPGIGLVTAVNGSVTGSATVNVIVGPIDHITLVPHLANVGAGGTLLFTATAYDGYNNIITGVEFIWTTNAGSVDPTGLFTAQTTPKIGFVTAANGSFNDTAIVNVIPGPIYRIVVIPDPVSIVVGGSETFMAIGFDAYDNVIPGVGFLWSTNVGSITVDGIFTAQTITTAGLVTATNGSVNGSAAVYILPGPVDHIIVTPDTAVVTVGDEQAFVAIAYDVYDNVIPDAGFVWTTDVGSVDPIGLFSAQTTPGSGTVSATNGTVSGWAILDVVVGGVDHIVVSPDPVIVVVGGTQPFTAIAYDIYDNEISGAVFDWTTHVGSVDATGLFTAQAIPGVGTVTATNGTVSGNAGVTVAVGPVDHIIVAPDPVTVVVGGMQSFTAVAYDVYDNAISGVVFVWTTDVGTIDSSGHFTAQTMPGAGNVTATNGTVSGSAIVDVIVGDVDHIIVTPDPVTITVGENQQFTATAYDIHDNPITDATILWDTDVGAVNSTGYFTAQTIPAIGSVTATCGAVSGSSYVEVIIGLIDHIVVSPDPVSIIVNGVLQFNAVAYDFYNNVIQNAEFVWTTNVGTVNATGYFTAQSSPGIGTVNATNGTISGFSSVVVVLATVHHIKITPAPVTIAVGGTLLFTATAYDEFNKIITGVEVIWATNVGTIDATGFFTAQTISKVGIVTATNGTVTGYAVVNVIPGPLDHIVVVPNPANVVVGTSKLFTAIAFDVYNNVIPRVTYVWTTNVGSVGPTGLFTAQTTPAVGVVTATSGTVNFSAVVKVIPGPVDHIVVTPDPATVIVSGTQLFTAAAYDSYNNPIPGVNFAWSTNVGLINAAGLFFAQSTPGTGTVTATNGTVFYSAVVNVVSGIVPPITPPGPVGPLLNVMIGPSHNSLPTVMDIKRALLEKSEVGRGW